MQKFLSFNSDILSFSSGFGQSSSLRLILTPASIASSLTFKSCTLHNFYIHCNNFTLSNLSFFLSFFCSLVFSLFLFLFIFISLSLSLSLFLICNLSLFWVYDLKTFFRVRQHMSLKSRHCCSTCYPHHTPSWLARRRAQDQKNSSGRAGGRVAMVLSGSLTERKPEKFVRKT